MSALVISFIADQEVILPPFDINRYPEPFLDQVYKLRNRQKHLFPKVYECKGDMSFPIQVLMNSILINNQMLLQNISDPTTGFFEFRSRGYYIAINKFDSGSSTTIYFEDLKKNSKGKTVCDDFTLRLFDMVDAPSEVIEWLDEYNMEPGNFISLSLDPVNPNRDPLMLRPEPIITDSTVKAVTKVKTAIANHNPKPWSYLGARTAKAIKACKQARSRGVIVNGGIGC